MARTGRPLAAPRARGPSPTPKETDVTDKAVCDPARREFREETGLTPPTLEDPDSYFPLGDIQQLSGKIVTGWAFEGDFDPARLVSVTSKVQWPPHSGREIEVPEIDRAEWFTLDAARKKILPAQTPFLERLARHLTSLQSTS